MGCRADDEQWRDGDLGGAALKLLAGHDAATVLEAASTVLDDIANERFDAVAARLPVGAEKPGQDVAAGQANRDRN